jgi:APA family basic amino acid/polyamine antiporter
MPAEPLRLGLWSGVGLVAANMIGAGVFLSAGFMAQDLGPGAILAAWVVGAAVALAGTRAYAELAVILPRSGGEYRYVTDLMHPGLGYVAGWATLLVGFSAPVAVDALAAASFAGKVLPVGDPRILASVLIVGLTALHALDLGVSKWTQNALVAVKATLLLAFVGAGLALGQREWPAWQPPHASSGFPIGAFMASQFYIAFAFSGWNAAAYAAEEFAAPRRTVPRAMALGCGLVAILYLLVNWVFVANLTPERATAVFRYESEQVTLGHVVLETLVGPLGARLMSGVAVVAFLSAMSAMTFAGPRVYAAMAKDGCLPRALAERAGRPPTGAVVLQGVLALVLLFTHGPRQILQNLGAILTLFSALAASALFAVRFQRTDLPQPRRTALVAAAVYVGTAAAILGFGLWRSRELLWWLGAVLAAAAAAALLRRRPRG